MATKIRKGKTFQYNEAIARKYSKQLKALTGRMTASVRKEMLDLFKSTGVKDNFAVIDGISSQTRILLNKLDTDWQKKFNEIARNLSPRMMRDVLRESKAASSRNLRQLFEHNELRVRDTSTQMQNVFKASVTESVELFKTIPQEYFKEIGGEVMRTIQDGGSLKSLTDYFKTHDDKTIHRAENIAMDQTRKAYSGFNRTMCLQAGVTKAIWIHTGGTTHPRQKHKDFDGQVFDLAKGAPVGTMKGGSEYVQPATEPFCRCSMKIILDFNDEVED